MKLRVFDGKFTILGLINKNSYPNTHNEINHLRRMHRMKLSAFGENGKGHKLEPISANFRLK